MKMSQIYSPTLREIPADAEIISHQYMLRAGLIRKVAAGIYTYLPLGYRVIRKVEQIVREEMNKKGGQEVLMPSLQPSELWQQSGRWEVYGDEMMRLQDRHSRHFCLGPTHEEIITDLVKKEVSSYKQLPISLYQIQTKFRDEVRPRFGLMRGREFIMKDLYSFDRDHDGLDQSYNKMYDAYCRIFERCGLEYRAVEADSGAIGGNSSHEFMVMAESGESTIVYCNGCEYAANDEKAISAIHQPFNENMQSLHVVDSPNVRTVNQVVEFFGITHNRVLKTLVYETENRLVAVVIRGDRDVNEIKLQNVLNCNHLNLLDEQKVENVLGCNVGYLGPINLKNIFTVVDEEASHLVDGICGANENSKHYIHVNYGRDYEGDIVEDIRLVIAGDACIQCGQPLRVARGIEVGHIFKLGKKYSESLDATFLDESGKSCYFEMGCYGIGIGRTMAASIEQNHDDNGIIWPTSIAPYHAVIVQVHHKDQQQQEICEKLNNDLNHLGVETVFDDRNERVGVKFKDADLIGFPVRLTVGPKTVSEGTVEVKIRKTNEQSTILLEQVATWLATYIKDGME